ncbi:hypothetical protein JCM3263A_17930 [Thermobifida fusca]|uniref:Lsr2 protein n=2 Tax=Thermobifida fusca TaxID=2021 RepID=A0A9P2WQF0_THEFU|nr:MULTISPECIES: hypothetical protein [Thermobifida]AAZ56043.1 hypothetical protein Tfu_2010 [Thermobifida fusca YX]EOR70924.1 hypothetical protein TM51_10348 [Thermobifida fusca TM51]MBO2530632.1 hypothetical protein [Thermobifida sp.]MDD6792675.1 hypothetical protein [Thermobifida fusca]PPS92185.1 hypothetical protein BH05_11340 [Thermobifida fusca]
MVTEVFTRKYCDPHAVNGEKVEATEAIQFAWDGVIREVDACVECKQEYDARFEPLLDYSRPVKRRRTKKTTAENTPAESTPAEN